MSVRTKHKTVKPEAENKSWFGRFKGIFKTESIEKATSQKRMYQKATEEQIKKMFRLRKNNPKLCLHDIAKAVGVSEPVCRYWLALKEEDVLSSFKAKRGRKVAEKQKEIRVKLSKQKKSKSKDKPTDQAPPTETDYDKTLEQLTQKEKYWVEHQADPNYWKGAKPPHAVATEANFKDQKRRNNINRVNTAKLLQSKEEFVKEDKRKDRLEKKHKDTKMKIHFDCCPSCNRKSHLTVDQYNSLIYDEFKRQKNWSKKNSQLMQREKDLDERLKDPTVAEQVKMGREICQVCDASLSYSQATRSSAIYNGEFYCDTHEPKKEVK